LRDNEDLLFVLGAGKTATTALCGLLNSHPEVFMMCEVYFNNCVISRWGNKLLKSNPEFLPCFFQDIGTDRLENYRKGMKLLRDGGRDLKFFGDKFADMNTGFSEQMGDARVIFSARDLPEWLAKDSVRKWYPIDQNLVPYAVQYSKHFIESFLLPRVRYVTMDDFLKDNAGVTAGIWKFLDLAPPANAEKWWETIGHYPPGDPKQSLNWWRGHGSSAVAPQENDTRVRVKRHAFWDEILPVFNKYYEGANKKTFAASEVKADLKALQKLIDRFNEPIENFFALYDSKSHKDKFNNKKRPPKRGLAGVLRKLGLR